MNTTTLQQLHRLVDIVNPAEYDIVYKLLLKFIPETDPLSDEIEAIERLDAAIASGDTIKHGDIDWN